MLSPFFFVLHPLCPIVLCPSHVPAVCESPRTVCFRDGASFADTCVLSFCFLYLSQFSSESFTYVFVPNLLFQTNRGAQRHTQRPLTRLPPNKYIREMIYARLFWLYNAPYFIDTSFAKTIWAIKYSGIVPKSDDVYEKGAELSRESSPVLRFVMG